MPRPLKIFTIEGCNSHLPREILDVVDAPAHVNQGDIYIVARTKKDAATWLSDMTGGNIRPDHIHESHSDNVKAITSATSLLENEGDAIAMRSSGPSKIAARRGKQWFLVGETTYQIPGSRRLLHKPEFQPIQRREPVRVTIELDADTDPELIEKLVAGTGGSCRVTFGRITEHSVTGKVVES